MPNKFSSGKFAISQCDRCGFRFKLAQLKTLVIKTKEVNIRVCPECWEADHPQLKLGMYPVNDPQAVRNPRPDTSYAQSRSFIEQLYTGAGMAFAVGALSDSAGASFLNVDGIPLLIDGYPLDVSLYAEVDGFTVIMDSYPLTTS
jgi:hypothetical protein